MNHHQLKVCSHLLLKSLLLQAPHLIFTNRVCSTRREVIVSPCLSVHTCGGGGGVPQPSAARGSRVAHLGHPPIRPGQGYPCWGVPPLGYSPSDLAGGGYPCRGGGVTPPQVTDGVLDTPRSVCLLRSRRRTFLFNVFQRLV